MPEKQYKHFCLHMLIALIVGLVATVGLILGIGEGLFGSGWNTEALVIGAVAFVLGLWNARYLPPTD